MSDEPKDREANDDERGDGTEPKEGEPPMRVCPVCSAQMQTSSDTCPHCGASYIRSRSMRARRRVGAWSKRRKAITLGVIAALVGGLVGAGVIVKVNHDNQVAREHREQQEHREQIAQANKEERELLAEEKEEQEVEESLELVELEFEQEELEKAITKDATEKTEEGLLEGPILKTECEPEGGELDPHAAAQHFDCLAVDTVEGGYSEGYRYEGTYNYAKGVYSWRLGGE